MASVCCRSRWSAAGAREHDPGRSRRALTSASRGAPRRRRCRSKKSTITSCTLTIAVARRTAWTFTPDAVRLVAIVRGLPRRIVQWIARSKKARSPEPELGPDLRSARAVDHRTSVQTIEELPPVAESMATPCPREPRPQLSPEVAEIPITSTDAAPPGGRLCLGGVGMLALAAAVALRATHGADASPAGCLAARPRLNVASCFAAAADRPATGGHARRCAGRIHP